MKNMLWSMVAVGALSGAAIAAPAAKASDEAGIKAAAAEFATTWDKHDPKALTALFTPDATVINPWGRIAKGSAEIEKLFADEHGATGMLKGTTQAITVTMWRPMGTAWAFVDADTDLTNVKMPDGKMGAIKGHAVLTMTKKGGKWLMADVRPYMFAPAPAAPKAAAPAAAPAPTTAKK